MKCISFLLLLSCTVTAQSINDKIVVEMVDNLYIPKNVLGQTRANIRIVNISNEPVNICTIGCHFIEIKSKDSLKWESADKFYNFDGYIGQKRLNPSDTISYSIYFDLFSYLRRAFAANQGIINENIDFELRLVVYQNKEAEVSYSDIYSFNCPPLDNKDKDVFLDLLNKNIEPFAFYRYLANSNFGGLNADEKQYLQDIIENYEESTFAILAKIALATSKSYDSLTLQNKADIENLLSIPLQSDYYHIRLSAEEIQQKINN